MAASIDPAMGITKQLAGFAANVSYEQLPSEAVAVLKKLLLDTIGTALAGTTLGEACREVSQLVGAAGGAPEATVLGFGTRAPALTAALANGSTAHALNYDALGADGGHLGVNSVPAPLAAAERRGDVSGKELLAAMAAAAEITARIAGSLSSAGVNANERFLEGQLLGYFSAAVGAGRVMGLTSEQMHSALGLALMQSGGTMQVVFDGDPPAKAIYGGFSNLGGMLAALLSQQGVNAEIAAIEGRAGLFGLFYQGKYSAEVLQKELGREFLLLRAHFKPWPTSGLVHPFIEAASALAERHRLSHEDIDRVLVRGDSHILHWCEPRDERIAPPNAASAANSIQFGTAKALVNGEVGLGDFTANGLKDSVALQVASRTAYEIDDSMDDAGSVEVLVKGGERLSQRVDTPLGHPENPLSFDRIVAKFRDCAQYAAAPIMPESLEELIELVDRLEEVDDVSKLASLVMG